MSEDAREKAPERGAAGSGHPLSPLVFVGLLPPPIDGQRVATAQMQAVLGRSFRLRVLNIGPRDPASLTGRLVRIARAISVLCIARTRGWRRLYLAPYSGHGLWLAALLQVSARLLGYRIVVHLHSHLAVNERLPAMAAFTRAGGARVIYICLGVRMAADLSRRYPAAKRTHVVGNALMVPVPSAPRRRRTIGDGPLRLGHLSNLDREKGLDTVLLTAHTLAAAGLPFLLELAGPAKEVERGMIADAVAADPDRVRWLGPLYGPAKDRWFESLDIFLLPTRYAHEASPLVLFEAMRAGAVPIATARGCIPDDLGDAGIVVADTRPQAFAEATRTRLHAYGEGRDDLDAASARAFERFLLLRRSAEDGLAQLVEAIRDGAAAGPIRPTAGRPDD